MTVPCTSGVWRLITLLLIVTTGRVTAQVDGGWSDWDAWSNCSVTCGNGTETRNRTCTNPAPANGGADCDGLAHEKRGCNTGLTCPVDGGWSDWGVWSNCSVTCGNGTNTRNRTCTNPAPANCVGQAQEKRDCNTSISCPVDGGWSNWGEWSDCNATCRVGFGTRTRNRTCTNPAPVYAGVDCDGLAQETQYCYLLPVCLACPPGYRYNIGMYAKCLFFNKRPLSYSMAEEHCRGIGGRLLELEKKQYVKRMKTILKRVSSNRKFGIWVGRTKTTTKGTILSEDGTKRGIGLALPPKRRGCVAIRQLPRYIFERIQPCEKAKNSFFCETKKQKLDL